MSSTDSPKHRVIRVKRRADEEKSISNKRCKFVGTCGTSDDKDIYHLLSSTQTLPQTDTQDVNQLKICNLEDVCDSVVFGFKPKEIITCNGEPLESVDNELNESLEYLYDIYVYEDNESLEFENQLQYREVNDSEDDSNDENYAYNDYPDECEVSEDVIDYYSYRDDQNISQRDLELNFQRNNISSDYDLSDEDIDSIQKYIKKKGSDDSGEVEDEEEEEEY